jgi:hypothetical protein
MAAAAVARIKRPNHPGALQARHRRAATPLWPAGRDGTPYINITPACMFADAERSMGISGTPKMRTPASQFQLLFLDFAASPWLRQPHLRALLPCGTLACALWAQAARLRTCVAEVRAIAMRLSARRRLANEEFTDTSPPAVPAALASMFATLKKEVEPGAARSAEKQAHGGRCAKRRLNL